MTFKQLDAYLLSKQGASYDYPFDEKVRVYRIGEKMFAIIFEDGPIRVNLKCDPIYALELRSIYEGVIGGYHMNKKHWNTVNIEESDVDEESIKELIDHSYELVYDSLTKKKREVLGSIKTIPYSINSTTSSKSSLSCEDCSLILYPKGKNIAT